MMFFVIMILRNFVGSVFFFFSSRRRHTRYIGDWSSDVCSSDLFTGWTDHTDVRPTMLSLLGLTDDYGHDGRVVSQVLAPTAIPAALQSSDAVALAEIGRASCRERVVMRVVSVCGK